MTWPARWRLCGARPHQLDGSVGPSVFGPDAGRLDLHSGVPSCWVQAGQPVRSPPKTKGAVMPGPVPERWGSYLLSALRIVAGFLFMAHGTQKLFGWPASE